MTAYKYVEELWRKKQSDGEFFNLKKIVFTKKISEPLNFFGGIKD
jgi:hypothetical protein